MGKATGANMPQRAYGAQRRGSASQDAGTTKEGPNLRLNPSFVVPVVGLDSRCDDAKAAF